MMESLTITPKPESTLREYGAPSKQVIKTPIVIPEVWSYPPSTTTCFYRRRRRRP
jgi:hypothetical protein